MTGTRHPRASLHELAEAVFARKEDLAYWKQVAKELAEWMQPAEACRQTKVITDE